MRLTDMPAPRASAAQSTTPQQHCSTPDEARLRQPQLNAGRNEQSIGPHPEPRQDNAPHHRTAAHECRMKPELRRGSRPQRIIA